MGILLKYNGFHSPTGVQQAITQEDNIAAPLSLDGIRRKKQQYTIIAGIVQIAVVNAQNIPIFQKHRNPHPVFRVGYFYAIVKCTIEVLGIVDMTVDMLYTEPTSGHTFSFFAGQNPVFDVQDGYLAGVYTDDATYSFIYDSSIAS